MKELEFMIVDSHSEAKLGRWYQCKHWKSKTSLSYKSPRKPRNWKIFIKGEEIHGMALDGRWRRFFEDCDKEGWRLSARKNPKNSADRNACEVWSHVGSKSALVGYLPRPIAADLAEVESVGVIPRRMYMPEDRTDVRVTVDVYAIDGAAEEEAPRAAEKKLSRTPKGRFFYIFWAAVALVLLVWSLAETRGEAALGALL